MRGKQKDKGIIFPDGGLAAPSNTFIRNHTKDLEDTKQKWFKAHPYRGTKAEVGGKR